MMMLALIHELLMLSESSVQTHTFVVVDEGEWDHDARDESDEEFLNNLVDGEDEDFEDDEDSGLSWSMMTGYVVLEKDIRKWLAEHGVTKRVDLDEYFEYAEGSLVDKLIEDLTHGVVPIQSSHPVKVGTDRPEDGSEGIHCIEEHAILLFPDL